MGGAEHGDELLVAVQAVKAVERRHAHLPRTKTEGVDGLVRALHPRIDRPAHSAYETLCEVRPLDRTGRY